MKKLIALIPFGGNAFQVTVKQMVIVDDNQGKRLLEDGICRELHPKFEPTAEQEAGAINIASAETKTDKEPETVGGTTANKPKAKAKGTGAPARASKTKPSSETKPTPGETATDADAGATQ